MEHGILNLGQLTRYLENEAEEAIVRFNFGYMHPTTLNSYRGYYCDLALGYAEDDGKEVSVKTLLAMLKGAVGKKFTGWKGGEFRMTTETPVWVASPGDNPGVGIIGVRGDDYLVILETRMVDG